MEPLALPPETLEGWFALTQVFSLDRSVSHQGDDATRQTLRSDTAAFVGGLTPGKAEGWSAAASLIGSAGDLMVLHFRQGLESLDAPGQRTKDWMAARGLSLSYSFLSVTEAGLYHVTAQLARDAVARGGKAGDDEYRAALAARAEAERVTPHAQKRLYPQLPADMPYVCFYPMSKRRAVGQNWYALSLDERSRLMQTHGLTGRRYAGRVLQVITGAIGFDAWEWGVTLFAKDPLDFKRLVTDMRFDEVSANYADFGTFYVGRIL
jgi:peroxiredoxin